MSTRWNYMQAEMRPTLRSNSISQSTIIEDDDGRRRMQVAPNRFVDCTDWLDVRELTDEFDILEKRARKLEFGRGRTFASNGQGSGTAEIRPAFL